MAKVKNVIMFICAVFIVIIALSACGANKETGHSEASGTRIYESDKGKIELPANPQRVVVAVQDYVGDVLALGVKPVGTAGWVFDVPYYKNQLSGVESVGNMSGISVEKIVSLKPDVILTYQEDQVEQLSQIAPTVCLPFGKYNYKDRLMEIGKILNKEQEAKEWIAGFDKKAEERKQALFQSMNKEEKVAIVELTAKELFLYGRSYGRGGEIIYNQFGLRAPDKVEKDAFPQGWAKISLEAMPEYLEEADHIFLGVRDAAVGETGDAKARQAELTSLGIWSNLPAVKAGRVYEYNVQSFYFTDPVALDNQLDFIADSLASGRKKETKQ